MNYQAIQYILLLMKNILTLSRKYVSSLFNTTALVLIIYALSILYVPYILDQIYVLKFFDYISLVGLNNIKVAVNFIVTILVSISCIFFLKLVSGLKTKDYYRPTHISFKDILFDHSLLVSGSTILLYLFTYLTRFIRLEIDILFPIGLSHVTQHFDNYVYLFLFIFVSPLFEELIFRGVLLKFLGRFGYRFGVLTTSLIYAILHQSFVSMVVSFFIAFLLAKQTIRYKSVQPAIITHILYNAFFALYHILPNELYPINVVLLIFVVLMTIYGFIYGKIKIVKLKKNASTKDVLKLFFLRWNVVLLILIILLYPIFIYFI